ncbi:hypothetical protein CUR178_04944 [Leishmania enriettii]|uniref:Uncharacterized protein n=1 Tax=Leishmania enriettii TaxID=5663 RepID=A0A836GQK8_LEIEN|nr:hypothetical protein CUR178_04944 [Leishmania enriettii]
MKKRRGLSETRTVAARLHKRGGTETTRQHHFPLYSHPMFRAALHNAAAVQNAVEEQSGRVDPRALDAALESMVAQLMKQQHKTEGGVPPNSGRDDLIVTESQLLALLAEAMETSPQPSNPQSPASVFEPMKPEAVEAFAPTAVFASSPPSLEGQFIPNQGYHVSHPPLHARGGGVARRTSPPRTSAVSVSGALSSLGYGVPDVLNVVSIDSLQQTALKSHGHSDAQSTPGLPPRSERPASVVSVRTATERVKLSDRWSTNARSKRLTASPYSLLPPLVASPGLTASSALPTTAPSCQSPSPSSLSFRAMDRRPGINAGPVAQQSVDAQQLHQVPDAVFASMDVLMDANSCCLRRRRRLQATNENKNAPLSLNPNHLPLGRGGAARSCFAFGCGSKGAILNRMYVDAVHNTLPALPPPRTAAEAKARRILETQRRKQRLHDQQQHPVSESSLLTDCSNNTHPHFSLAQLHRGPIELPADPLGRYHRGQRGARRCGSARRGLLSTGSSVSSSSVAGAVSASTLPPGTEALPLFTLHGIASESAYVQAVHFANRFAG